MSRRLGGFSRLGIVLSLTWTLLVGWLTLTTLPEQNGRVIDLSTLPTASISNAPESFTDDQLLELLNDPRLKLEDFQKAVADSGAKAEISKDLFDALGARNVVNRYQSAGAAGGEPLRRQLEDWKKRLGM